VIDKYDKILDCTLPPHYTRYTFSCVDGSDGTVVKTWLFLTRVLTLEQSSRQTGTRTSPVAV
jgi:hypothetical protein